MRIFILTIWLLLSNAPVQAASLPVSVQAEASKSTIQPADEIEYRIMVQNVQDANPIGRVLARITLPAKVTYTGPTTVISTDSEETVLPSGITFSEGITVGTNLLGGSSLTIAVPAKVSSDLGAGECLEAKVSVIADAELISDLPVKTCSSVPEKPILQANLLARQHDTDKPFARDAVLTGDTIDYQLTLTNTDLYRSITDLHLRILLPSLTRQLGSPLLHQAGKEITLSPTLFTSPGVTISSLAKGETATVTISLQTEKGLKPGICLNSQFTATSAVMLNSVSNTVDVCTAQPIKESFRSEQRSKNTFNLLAIGAGILMLIGGVILYLRARLL